MDNQLKEKIEKEVKFFAKNNMCASCYDDIENFIDNMEDIICGDIYDCFESFIFSDCIDDLKYAGTEITDEVKYEVCKILKSEAKYWLSDYRKHRKDYE